MGRNQCSVGSNFAALVYHCQEIGLHLRKVSHFGTISFDHRYSYPHSYRLIPMGSFSRIEKTTGDKASYELYGSGDLHLGRLLHNRRFDIAMVAFLDCLKHLMDHIKAQDTAVDFPHQSACSSTYPAPTDNDLSFIGLSRIRSEMYPSNYSSIKRRLGRDRYDMSFWP